MKSLTKFVLLAIVILDRGVAQVKVYSQKLTDKTEIQEKDERKRKFEKLENKLGTTCPDGSPL